MINTLVASISAAFSSLSPLSLAAALLWGVLSVFLSPCHLGAIPLIIGYINDGKKPDLRRAALYSWLFALGLLVTLAGIGFLTSAAGRLLGDTGYLTRLFIGIFIVACGLWLMDIPPLSRINLSFAAPEGRRGAYGALSLGLVYGVALGPCSFAFLAPMLGFVFAAGTGQLAFGLSLMLMYAVGHTAAIVAAGVFGDRIASLLRSRSAGAAALWFKRALGLLVVVAGLSQLFGL